MSILEGIEIAEIKHDQYEIYIKHEKEKARREREVRCEILSDAILDYGLQFIVALLALILFVLCIKPLVLILWRILTT